jgi:hypothetical protein
MFLPAELLGVARKNFYHFRLEAKTITIPIQINYKLHDSIYNYLQLFVFCLKPIGQSEGRGNFKYVYYSDINKKKKKLFKKSYYVRNTSAGNNMQINVINIKYILE